MHAFYSKLEMTCWENRDIAFMAQFYFIGLSTGIINIPLSEKIGRKRILALYLGPIGVLGFSLCIYLNSYIAMCIGYLFVGIAKNKLTTCLLCASEQMDSTKAPYCNTIVYLLDSACTAVFCVWMLFVNRDVISYLHYMNILSIFFMVYLTAFTVESPKWHIIKNKGH